MKNDTRDGKEVNLSEEMLICEVSDQALEIAAGVPGYANVTEKFTAWNTNNCLLC